MLKQCAGLFAVILMTACVGQTGRLQDRERTALLKSVPSDAVALVCDNRIPSLVSVLDKSDKLRKLKLEDCPMPQAVLSYGYTGEKSAMLSIPSDTSSVFRSLIRRSDSLGLSSANVTLDGFNIFTVSGSGTMISESQHHIKSGTSIFNAPFFREAYRTCGFSDRVAFIRNQAIPRFCPGNFLDDLMQRRKLVEFMRGAACWTVIENSSTVRTFQNDENVYYGFFNRFFPAGELRVKELLPGNVVFVLSQPVGQPEWRNCRKKYLDAQSVLNRYEKEVSKYGKNANPEKWESTNNVEEAVAMLTTDGKLVCLRSEHWTANACESFNAGFTELLYGQAYSIQDAPAVSICDGWLLAGSGTAVDSVRNVIKKNLEDRIKSCRFYISTPEFDLCDTGGRWNLDLTCANEGTGDNEK